ncbi:MAG: F0F1 ATP synthase subunit A [Patescibacteria group bacterium]|nr:F0F1 ATP synthase subunit A [Patescibacteria group bacterium]
MTISLAAEPIFHLGGFPITNTLIASWVSVLFLVSSTARLQAKGLKAIPKGIQNVFEFVIEAFLKLMDGVTQDRAQSIRFFPWVMTIFLFIITSNWMGILPGFGTIGINEVEHGETTFLPFLRTVNSDLNVTVALAVISVVMTQIFGIMAIGVIKYSKRFLNFKNPIIGILEFIDQFAVLVSFSFRLFGNIFAGEVLLVIVSSLIPYVVPLPFYFLELFVGAIQAFVFAVLTLVFFKVASMEPH